MRGTKPGLNNITSKKPSAVRPQPGGADEVAVGVAAQTGSSPNTLTERPFGVQVDFAIAADPGSQKERVGIRHLCLRTRLEAVRPTVGAMKREQRLRDDRRLPAKLIRQGPVRSGSSLYVSRTLCW